MILSHSFIAILIFLLTLSISSYLIKLKLKSFEFIIKRKKWNYPQINIFKNWSITDRVNINHYHCQSYENWTGHWTGED